MGLFTPRYEFYQVAAAQGGTAQEIIRNASGRELNAFLVKPLLSLGNAAISSVDAVFIRPFQEIDQLTTAYSNGELDFKQFESAMHRFVGEELFVIASIGIGEGLGGKGAPKGKPEGGFCELTRAAKDSGESASGSANRSVGAIQGILRRYPQIIDPRTGKNIRFPSDIGGRVPLAERVPWGATERSAFIAEWARRGYPEPRGGWKNFDIHHIKPREFGGTNAFENLVPVESRLHEQFNAFWRGYNGL